MIMAFWPAGGPYLHDHEAERSPEPLADHEPGPPNGDGRASVAAGLTGALWLHSSLCSSRRVCWMG